MRLAPRLRAGVLICLLLFATTAAHAQERVPMDGSIFGQIVDTEGQPVSGAVVILTGGLVQISLTVSAPRELEGGPQRVLSDGRGRFVFNGLASGAYSIEASKSGFVPGAYGRRRVGAAAQSILLAPSERRTDIRITVWPFVAITGTVTDEAGEPVVGVQVTAQRKTFIATRPRLSATTTVVTDDRGAYRFDGVPPGSWVVCVPSSTISLPSSLADTFAQNPTAPDARNVLMNLDFRLITPGGLSGRRVGDVLVTTALPVPLLPAEPDTMPAAYTTTCYPGTHAGNAERLEVEAGTQRDNVDITLRPVPTAQVSGTLSDPEGSVKNVTVRLLPPHVSALAVDVGAEVGLAVTDDTGAFVFPAVPHGDYTLKVMRTPTTVSQQSGAPAPSSERTGWAEVPVSVGAEGVSGLTVPLRHGFRITGRLDLDGTTKPGPELIERFSIQLDPADGSGSRMAPALSGSIYRNGRITTNEIPPGRYVVLFLAFAPDRLAMPGWEAVGATIDGRDVSHTPFELTGDVTTLVMTLSDHASDITGTVRDAQGMPDPGAAVLMFPSDRERWVDRGFSTRAMRVMRASATGTYRMGSVPPGDYVLAAIPDEEAGNWEDPEVLLAAMRTGTRLSISRDQKKTQDLVTTPLRIGGR